MNSNKLASAEKELFIELSKTDLSFNNNKRDSSYNGINLVLDEKYQNVLIEKIQLFKKSILENLENSKEPDLFSNGEYQRKINEKASKLYDIVSGFKEKWESELLNTKKLIIDHDKNIDNLHSEGILKTEDDKDWYSMTNYHKKVALEKKTDGIYSIVLMVGFQCHYIIQVKKLMDIITFEDKVITTENTKPAAKKSKSRAGISLEKELNVNIVWNEDPELILDILLELNNQDIVDEFSLKAFNKLKDMFSISKFDKIPNLENKAKELLKDTDEDRILWKKNNIQLAELFWGLSYHEFIGDLKTDNGDKAAEIYKIFKLSRARSESYNPRPFQKQFQPNIWINSKGIISTNEGLIKDVLKKFIPGND